MACIRIVCRYHGLCVPMSYLRHHVETGRLGISVRDIVAALGGLGMHSMAVRVGVDDLRTMPLPAILYWNRQHFVVLYKADVDKGVFSVVDPSEGKMKYRTDDFSEYFVANDGKGIAVLAEPDETFESRQKDMPPDERRLPHLAARIVREHSGPFAAVCAFMLLAMGADVALPFVFQRTIDEGIHSGDIQLIWLLVFSQLFIFFGNYLSNCVVEYLLTKIGLRMSIRMINDYLKKIICLPMSFFATKVSSDLIQKVDDHNRIQNFMVSLPDTLVFTVINVVLFSGILIYFSRTVFLIFIVCTLLSVVWTALFMRRRREVDYAYFSKLSENRNNLYELVNGIDEIKANCAQHQRLSTWDKVQSRINDLSLRKAMLKMYQNGGNVFFVRFRDIAITGICATLVVRGEMSIGLMMTLSYIVGRLSAPFANLINSVNMFQDVSMSYDRIEEVMNADLADGRVLPAPQFDSVEFRDVRFRYPGAGTPFVLHGIDLTIPRGRTTAIVGPSGCGKSTVLKILLGFFNPTSGEVLVEGVRLDSICEESWLSKMAVVMQNGNLFSGDILTNIALSDAEPDLGRARRAAEIACIDEFIDSLPMGFSTPVGKIGMEISGGQKQRLLIARAIYRCPEIIVLDEATSSLDAITERRVIENIMAEFRNRTVVIVAHRLSSVKNADNIIVMDSGRIEEQGTHAQLLCGGGRYYSLVEHQMEFA